MFIVCVVVCGVSAVAMQILMIRKAHRDRRYALPLVATCLACAWDSLVLLPSPFEVVRFHFPLPGPMLALIPMMDLVLVLSLLVYGPAEFPRYSKTRWYTMVATCLVLAFGIVYVVCRFVRSISGDAATAAYTLAGVAVLIDLNFLTMLRARRTLAGQSLSIAAVKPLALCSASFGFWLFWPGLSAATPLAVLCFADLALCLAYIIAVYLIRAAQRGQQTGLVSTRSFFGKLGAQYATRT